MNYYDLLYLIPPATVLFFAIWFFYPSLAGKGDENIARGVCLVRPLHCVLIHVYDELTEKTVMGLSKWAHGLTATFHPFSKRKRPFFVGQRGSPGGNANHD